MFLLLLTFNFGTPEVKYGSTYHYNDRITYNYSGGHLFDHKLLLASRVATYSTIGSY